MIRKIISGGQTGADQDVLVVAIKIEIAFAKIRWDEGEGLIKI